MKNPLVAQHWGGDFEGAELILAEDRHLFTAMNRRTNTVRPSFTVDCQQCV